MVPDKDPLSLTPVVNPDKQNKRPLEVTPPSVENKSTRNEKVPETSKQLVFSHSEPDSARMDENAPVTMKSLTDYFDSKFDCFQNNDLEEKEEGFVGPRLPRMMTDQEVKAVLDSPNEGSHDCL